MRNRRAAAVLLSAALLPGAGRLHAFLGFADTSLVTVVANPAEAANWASELARLTAALSAAEQTLATVEALRGFAGDPAAAVAALRDLEDITSGLRALSGSAQTDAELLSAWQALGAAGRLEAAAGVLATSGAGSTMTVFGAEVPRNAALYQPFAEDASRVEAARAEVSLEQGARSSSAGELAAAWSAFRAASTESQKQAILSEISQIQAEDQLMAGRRRALLDDMDLADRQGRDLALTRGAAADEALLAESAALSSGEGGRATAAESERMATLQKAEPGPAPRDYSGLQIWTTADASGGGP